MDQAPQSPPPRLYYEGAPQAIISEPLFVGASFIKSLSITFRPAPVEESITGQLGKVILSLPLLKRLILKQAADRFWGDKNSLSYPAFQLEPSSKLPATLRILSFTNFTFDAEQAAAWAQCAQGIQHLALDAYPQISTLLEALTGSVPGFKSIKLRVRNNSDCKMLLGLITNPAIYEGPR
ncbi:hypothetical protein ASPSYDRAFT_28629 [Aspergillus sydowii CBS 593.65]|uniref:Uncharacterized protein n=1 Tax=Aspergillus sydowii CBS 593.65 TaxID=1036612 RepID=A0A1L9TUD0_9EURO|nr:uncharacterized protein ASPSYDRAFT_28629 [Aspergillus sydowii CBS 593.65]OJJ63021.1 hypothetical protein ASPSYDRAFT_28629 [Aspergillus sydowii CBS 593.65]